MQRTKVAAARVSSLGKRLWQQCLKEVEEEMRLEASKRMRLVPRVPETGYIRLGGVKEKAQPPTKMHESTPITEASSHNVNAHQQEQNGQNRPAEQQQHTVHDQEEDPLGEHLLKQHLRSVIDQQVSLSKDFPAQHQQVVSNERYPLESHLSEKHHGIVKNELDPLETDVPGQHQHTVKEELDPLEVSLPAQHQYAVKEEPDPLEVHLPEQTVIKIEYDDEQQANQSFDAKLRCWALTYQIQPAAYDALLALLRQNYNFQHSADK